MADATSDELPSEAIEKLKALMTGEMIAENFTTGKPLVTGVKIENKNRENE